LVSQQFLIQLLLFFLEPHLLPLPSFPVLLTWRGYWVVSAVIVLASCHIALTIVRITPNIVHITPPIVQNAEECFLFEPLVVLAVRGGVRVGGGMGESLWGVEAKGLFVNEGVAFVLLEMALQVSALRGPHYMIIGVNGRYIGAHAHSIVYHSYTNAVTNDSHKIKGNDG
jgi:hypothetical protein